MVRKNQAKALDSMQAALETEAKGKAEALRMKKKLEADAADLSLALEHAIAGNAETQNTIKKYQQQVRDAQVKVDEESAAKSAAADAKVAADRKAAAMQNALEESRALLETADRQRRSAEQELADTNETLADLGNVNQSIAAAKRKLESEYNQLGADLDEMTNEARLSEDKAARAMVDAARLADELRCEQDVAMNLEKDKKLLEAQCKDAGARADEAEVNARVLMSPLVRAVDQDNSGQIDAKELGQALANGDMSQFSQEACQMMINMFDSNLAGTIDVNEFGKLFQYINQWKAMFEGYDRDRSGQIDQGEFTQALQQMGYRFSPQFVQNLLAKFNPRERKLTLDNFIIVSVQVKRLTDSFRSRDTQMQGSATMQYEDFIGLAMGAHK